MGALILCYHHINYQERIEPENFENNLKTLKKEGFKPIRLTDIYDYISKGKNPPKKSVHITFDDGYADNFLYAYPILKKYGFYATIFVIAGKVAENIKRATYDELVSMNISQEANELLEKSKFVSWEELKELVESGLFEVGSHSYSHKACFSSKRVVKFNNTGTIEWLYELTGDKRLGIPVYEKKWDCAARCLKDDEGLRDYLADFVSKKGGMLFLKNHNYKKILTRQLKKYVRENGVKFETEDEKERTERIKKEIYDSKTTIEEKLGIKANFFCYPWGDYDSITVEHIKNAGYKGALTLNVGLNTKDTNPYMLKRVEVRGGNWLSKRLGIYKSDLLSAAYSKIWHKV